MTATVEKLEASKKLARPVTYLRITPAISWSWNLAGRPFTHDREVVVRRTVHEGA